MEVTASSQGRKSFIPGQTVHTDTEVRVRVEVVDDWVMCDVSDDLHRASKHCPGPHRYLLVGPEVDAGFAPGSK